jgi:glutathione S-transferase
MITLYTSATPNGHRAAIALEESGLEYTVKAVDLAAGEHKRPAFLAVNATGRIPAIVDDSVVDDSSDAAAPFALSETLAIALYVSEKSGRLAPTSATERALAYQWAATVISGFGASTSGIYFARQIDETAHARLIAKFYGDLDVYLRAMDQHLQTHPYLGGSAFSFADVLAIPTIVLSMKNFKVDLEGFAALGRWREKVMVRPAVQRGFAIPG